MNTADACLQVDPRMASSLPVHAHELEQIRDALAYQVEITLPALGGAARLPIYPEGISLCTVPPGVWLPPFRLRLRVLFEPPPRCFGCPYAFGGMVTVGCNHPTRTATGAGPRYLPGIDAPPKDCPLRRGSTSDPATPTVPPPPK